MAFLKTWGQIDERLDPAFYQNIILLNKNIISKSGHPISTFKQKVRMQRGRFGHRPRNDPRYYNGIYPFIQTGNIVKASETDEKIEFTQTLNELGLSTSRLFDEKVVVITIAANIGYTAILDYPACFPDSLVALTPKGNKLSLEYLNIYIRFIREYIENLAPQAAQKNINLKQLGKLPIIIPDKEIQKEIISIMERAYSEKLKREKEAYDLQESIDDYILKELGIVILAENAIGKELFYVKANSVLGNRFDPYFHKPIFKINLNNIENGKNSIIALKNVILEELVKGILPNENQKDGDYKVIQISNINLDGTIDVAECTTAKPIYLSKHKLEKGDILIVITGATIGKVGFWDYEGEYFLGGDIVKFNTGDYQLNQIYAALLRTKPYQLQIKRCITGATNGHLSLKDVELLPLPNIVDQEVKKMISAQLSLIHSKVQLLKQEAEYADNLAKAEVEKILLRR